MHIDISLRDYFAAAALQGLLACPDVDVNAECPRVYFAELSYEHADAMLAARGQLEHQHHKKETKS